MENSRYLSELSKCVRCGNCKAFCPTYDEDLTEAMGARGRLALLCGLARGELKPSALLNDRIFSCILCGACSGLCPPGADIKEIIYHGRSILKESKESDVKRRLLRFLTKFSAKRPDLSFSLLKIAQHVLLPYLFKKGILPFRFELPEHHLRERVQVYPVSKKKGRVAVFTGCIVNFLYPDLGKSFINVLHRLGYEVVLPVGEVCCGAPLRTLGLEEEAAECARKNFKTFTMLNVEAILSLCPTCTLVLKEEYPKLIGKSIEKAVDISSFIIRTRDPLLPFSTPRSMTATYHDPCHLIHGLGVKKEPREIIKSIGIELIEAEEERCCGFGGIFSLSYKELSQGLLEKFLTNYTNTGADMIITSCPGCMMQITKELKNKPVLHIIEIVEEALLQQP